MGEVLRDRYEVLEVLGEGGEGTVVRAVDRQHDRVVALKIRPASTPGRRSDLLAEARILLGVPPHPGVPLVREDFFDDHGRYVIAMDWVDGTDLEVLLRTEGRPGLPVASVLRWLADAAAALTHLHTQVPPVVHGDVKPANLVLTAGGRIVLVDFGLSSSPAERRRQGGTFGYVAPEVAAGATPGRASDVYALAATAWALLTGTPPTGVRPEWLGFQPDHADKLEAAIRRGLATDPGRRPATPGELVEGVRAGWGSTLPTGVLTFCLTDVEGSSGRWEAHPAAMARALVRHDDLIAAVVEAHGGRLLKSMGEGDATVSAFTSATDALASAAEIPARLAAEAWPEGLDLPVRVALHTGEAERRGDLYVGPVLATGGRLRSLAGPCEVLLSAATAGLVASSLPNGFGLVDLGRHRLGTGESRMQVFALSAPGVSAPPAALDCPYPGLLPFDSADRDRYFGREQVVEEVVRRLADGGFVAVVGSSGSGKSSLLRAGVAPRFPGVTLITPTTVDGHVLEGDELLVVDQFEEVRTAMEGDERVRFLDAVLTRRGPVVIGMRADFYGFCGQHPALATAVSTNQVLLGPMQEDDLRRAIIGPAASAGVGIEPLLVDLLVEDLASELGALPLLSHSLRATWQERDGRMLTLASYRATGGVRGAIATSADRLMTSLTTEDVQLARSILLRLIQPGDGTDDTRRRAQVEELQLPGRDPGRVDELLGSLAAARLVTLGDGTVELSHEALIREWPQLRAWLDDERDGLRLLGHLRATAREWERSSRDPSELYRGARLAATLEWTERATITIGGLEAEFLDACREREEHELADAKARAVHERQINFRLRGLLGGTALFLVVAIIAGALALRERGRAEEHAATARARAEEAELQRLVSESQAQRTRRRDLALLLALEADRLGQRAETRSSLFGALQADPDFLGYSRLPSDQPQFSALTHAADERIVVGDVAGRLLVIDPSNSQPIGDPVAVGDPTDVVSALVADPSGTRFAVGFDRSRRVRLVSLADLETGPARGVPVGRTVELADTVYRLAVSADGRVAAGGDTSGSVTVLDFTSGAVLGSVSGPTGPVAAAFASDGTLAAGSADAIRLWDAGLTPLGELRSGGVTGDGLLEFSTDGRLLLSAEAVKFTVARPNPPLLTGITAWDMDELRPRWEPITGVECQDVMLLRESAVCAHSSGQALEYGLASGRPLTSRVDVHQGGIRDLDVSPDHRTLVALSGANPGRLPLPAAELPETPAVARWSLDGRSIHGPVIGRPGMYPAAYSPDGSRLMTEAGEGPTDALGLGPRHLWDIGRREMVEQLPVLAATYAPDGRVAAISGDGKPLLLDMRTGERHRLDPLHSFFVMAIGFDAGRGRMALGYVDGVVDQRDLGSGRVVGQTIRLSKPGVDSVAYLRGGSVLAVAHDGEVELFDADQGTPVAPPLTGAHVAVSPDGSILTTATADGRITFRDPATFAPVGDEVVAGTSRVNNLVISDDASVMLVASWDLTARVFDVASRRQLGEPVPLGILAGSPHIGAILRPDGREIATADPGGVRVWDIDPESWRRKACDLAGRNLTRAEWSRYLPANQPYRVTCEQWPPARG